MAPAMEKKETSLFNGSLSCKSTQMKIGCLLRISNFTDPQRIEIEEEVITMIWKSSIQSSTTMV
jgi:hypothetical protein